MRAGSISILRSTDGTIPPSCSTRTTSRCSGVISEWVSSVARLWAPMMASWPFSVTLLMFMRANSRWAVLARRARFELGARLVMLTLGRRELRRQLRLDPGVRVALVLGLADRRHAVPLQTEHLPV